VNPTISMMRVIINGTGTSATLREQREQKAWNEDRVWERCNAWTSRVIHVLRGPNTRRGEERCEAIIAAAAHDARVLDVGCGRGESTLELLRYGPAHVLGIDISSEMIAVARDGAESVDRVDFRVQSVQAPLAERFDLIVGRAILHHIDFRELLPRAYEHNLLPGGHMVFVEPMSHPLAIAFHKLVRSAHTPDERPLGRSDVAWLHDEFPEVRLHGINLLSFPAGVVSTFLFTSAENCLMRASDALDRRLLAIAPWLSTYARQAIIVIDKPIRQADDPGL
jgi:2-polyprenyl-3-methyl-5-hydroxy-6-metoxy-1,4-benzoquinol methylase